MRNIKKVKIIMKLKNKTTSKIRVISIVVSLPNQWLDTDKDWLSGCLGIFSVNKSLSFFAITQNIDGEGKTTARGAEKQFAG